MKCTDSFRDWVGVPLQGPRKEVEFALWYRRKRKVAADECPE